MYHPFFSSVNKHNIPLERIPPHYRTMTQDNSIPGTPFSFYAFYQLYTHFHNPSNRLRFADIRRKIYNDRNDSGDKELADSSLFITWKKKGNDGTMQLRGCIGTFAKLPLLKGIEKYSLVAALQDSRFPPINAEELSSLKCSCNVLSEFEVIFKDGVGDIYDWDVGVHGVELFFKHPQTGRVCSSTFLPEVMEEQGWNKRETFLYLIEKAGCWHNVEEVLDNHEKYFKEVISYRGDKSEITYNEFKDLLDGGNA